MKDGKVKQDHNYADVHCICVGPAGQLEQGQGRVLVVGGGGESIERRNTHDIHSGDGHCEGTYTLKLLNKGLFWIYKLK